MQENLTHVSLAFFCFFFRFFFYVGGGGGLKANGSDPGKTLYNEVCNQDIPSLATLCYRMFHKIG